MDDNTFDDLIKKRLDGYEDPGFDPSALTSMQERLVGLKSMPWYAQTASRLFVMSSLLLFTFINAYLVKTVFVNVPNPQVLPVVDFRKEIVIDSLSQIITRMKGDLGQTHFAIARAEHVVEINKVQPSHIITTNSNPDSPGEVSYKINVGSASNIQTDLLERLTSAGLLSIEHGQGYVMLYVPGKKPAQFDDPDKRREPLTMEVQAPSQPRFIYIGDIETKDQAIASKNRMDGVSLATQKALEKHYFKGVGIEIAPHFDIIKGIFTDGASEITPRFGLTGDWILSPSLSVETGFDYLTIVDHLNQSSFNLQEQHSYQQFGAPKSVNLNYTLTAMPIAVKYRQWISSKNQAVLKIGITPYASLRKEYQYRYQYNDNSPDHDLVAITTLERNDSFKYFGATATSALGLTSMRVKNKGKFETSLFYERSVGHVDGHRSMQLVGLRAAYWLKIR